MSYLSEMAQSGYTTENISDFHYAMMPYLFTKYGIPKDGTIIDIGCGHGHCFVPLFQEGWRSVVAVDKYDELFEKFRRNYQVRTIKADASRDALPLETGCADAVICFHVIEHLPDYEHMMEEITRLLKPGGYLFLVTPDWRKQYKTFYRDPTHLRPFDKESLGRLLRMYNYDARILSWGSAYGFGRLRAYRWFKRLAFIGLDMFAAAKRQ